MFLLEAMANSCAIVATDVGQISEICTPDNGVLVTAGDVEELEVALNHLGALDASKLESLGGVSRKIVADKYAMSGAMRDLERMWLRAHRIRTSVVPEDESS